MNIINKLFFNERGVQKCIVFGTLDNANELEDMFRLRYDIYHENNYFNEKLINPPLDKDKYDESGKCIYFVAKMDDKIICTVRVIREYFLPTEKDCFNFPEPAEMNTINRNDRCELSRLIIIPFDKNNYFPRSLVLLLVLKSILDMQDLRNIRGGFSFITEKLYNKLNRLRFPFKYIKEAKLIYPENGLLAPYFYKNGIVRPIYFIRSEIDVYISNFLGNRLMLKIPNQSEYYLKNNFYTKILKSFKIL